MIEVKKLPYADDALEPHISADTISTHYGKHYKGYVANINKLIKATDYEKSNILNMIDKGKGTIFNNAAQIFNHEFYFDGLTGETTEPKDSLSVAFKNDYDTIEKFKEKFNAAAKGLFGSGWVWLIWDSKEENLDIMVTENALTPMNRSKAFVDQQYIPLMVCDIWEHSYYIDRKNDRMAYVEAFWNVVNWSVISDRFEVATNG